MALVAKNSIGKNLLYSLFAQTFVVVGIFVLFIGNDLRSTIIGWTFILIFGLALIIFVRRIFDNRPLLIIDQNGIFDRRLGIGIIDWSEIEQASMNSAFGNQFIRLSLRETSKFSRRTAKKRFASRNQIKINLGGINIRSSVIFDLIIKQLTSAKIKNLKNLRFELKSHHTIKNVVSDRSSDSQA